MSLYNNLIEHLTQDNLESFNFTLARYIDKEKELNSNYNWAYDNNILAIISKTVLLGKNNFLNLFLENGLPVQKKVLHKGILTSILILAIEGRHLETVKLLIEYDVTNSEDWKRRASDEAIEAAVVCNDAAIVDYLLSKGANPNVSNALRKDNGCILYQAINQGDLTIADSLIQHGANISDTIDEIISYRKFNCIKPLFDLIVGVRLSMAEKDFLTLLKNSFGEKINLVGATINGKLVTKALLASYKIDSKQFLLTINDLINLQDEQQQKALLKKVEKKSETIGATFDELGHFDTRTLYDGAATGNTQIVNVRLNNKVNPLKKTNGTYPIEIAAQNGHFEIVELLAMNANKKSLKAAYQAAKKAKQLNISDFLENHPLHSAIRSFDLTKIQAIANEKNIRFSQHNGYTALMCAVHAARYEEDELILCEMIKIILSHNPSLMDILDALSFLIGGDLFGGNYSFKAIELLLSHWKERPDALNYELTIDPDNAKTKPWYISLVFGAIRHDSCIQILDLLIKCGADINCIENKKGLMHIVLEQISNNYKVNNSLKIIEFLLNNNATPNITDAKGNTPLHIAATTNNLDLIKNLINAGADITSLNSQQKTPHDVAKENNFRDAYLLLSCDVSKKHKLAYNMKSYFSKKIKFFTPPDLTNSKDSSNTIQVNNTAKPPISLIDACLQDDLLAIQHFLQSSSQLELTKHAFNGHNIFHFIRSEKACSLIVSYINENFVFADLIEEIFQGGNFTNTSFNFFKLAMFHIKNIDILNPLWASLKSSKIKKILAAGPSILLGYPNLKLKQEDFEFIYSKLQPFSKENPELSNNIDGLEISIDKAYWDLFETKIPEEILSKDDLLKLALAEFHTILLNPKICVDWLYQLSEAFNFYYYNEVNPGKNFPIIDVASYNFEFIDGVQYPFPTEKFEDVDKHSALQKFLIAFLQKSGLAQEQYSWLGHAKPSLTVAMLKKGAFITENVLGGGLLHGKLSHMIQLIILIYAIKSKEITLAANGFQITIDDINDGFMTVKSSLNVPTWLRIRDSRFTEQISFSDPHRLSSFIMTDTKMGALSSSLIYSFCKGVLKFIDMVRENVNLKDFTVNDLILLFKAQEIHNFIYAPSFIENVVEKAIKKAVNPVNGKHFAIIQKKI